MKKIILIINVLIVLMCTNYTSYSQLTRTQLAKEQFNHSLFDDRGYSKNYSNYQRLNIGNSNGNLIYTYPISSENIHDGKLNLTMTFNANVNYVSLSEFNGSWEGEGNYWHSINANKSAWILGVNEFAVQTLTAQTMIYPDPNIKQVFRSDSSVTSDTIEMTKLINNWGIEGYHFCNEMKELLPVELKAFNRLSVDQIKLLKSDGSVLLLRNGDRDSAKLDIGQYYPVGTNEKGYGIVEYLDSVNYTEFSKYIEIIKQGLKDGNPNIAKYDGQFTFHDGLSFDKYDPLGFAKPRKLRYFPGDGYEYEFIEYYAPYGFGAICKMSAELKHYGGYKITPSAHPTIFYLHKVYYNDDLITKIDYGNGESKGHLLPFPEFDNNNQMLYYAEYDNIPGRANCTDIGGIQINYNSPKELEIKNNRLKITTKFDLVRAVFTDSSNPSNKSSNVLVKLNNAITSDLANNSYELDKINTIIDNAPRYYANSNITKIKVNEKVVTEFDYNSRKIEYKRRFFPILHSRTDINQSIKNPRKYSYRVSKLSGITEYDNQVKYSFRYLLEPTANVGSNDNICIDLCNGDGNEFQINGLQSYPNNIDNLQSYEWADACTRTKVGTVTETQMETSKLMKKIIYQYEIPNGVKTKSKTTKWTNIFSSADPAQAILSYKEIFDFNMKVIMPNDSLGGSELYTIFNTNNVNYLHQVLSLITDGQNTPVLESTVKTSTYKDESNDTLYSESNIILPIKEETTTMHGDTVSHVEVNYDYKLTADPIRNFKRVGITRFYGRNLETITTITKQSMPNQNPITTVQISNFKSYPLILNKEFYKYFTKTNSSNYFTSASSQYLHKCDCDNKSEQLQETIYQPTCSKGRPIIPLYNELQTQSFTYRYCSPDESPYLLEGKNINYYYDSIPITDISSDESAKNNYDMRHKNAKPEQITVYKPGFLSEYDDEDKILSINRYTSKPINKLTDNQYDYTSNIDERVNGQCGTTYSRECLLGQVKKQINTISNDTINYIYALSFDKIPTNVRDSLKYAYNDFSISKFKEVSEDFFTSKYYMIKYQGKDDIDEHTPFELSVVNSAGQIEISNNYSDYLTTYQYEGLGRIASITAPLDYSQSLSNKKYGASGYTVDSIPEYVIPKVGFYNIYQYVSKPTKTIETEDGLELFKLLGEPPSLTPTNNNGPNMLPPPSDFDYIIDVADFLDDEIDTEIQIPTIHVGTYGKLEYKFEHEVRSVSRLNLKAQAGITNGSEYKGLFACKIKFTINNIGKNKTCIVNCQDSNGVNIDLLSLLSSSEIGSLNGYRGNVRVEISLITPGVNLAIRNPELVFKGTFQSFKIANEFYRDFTQRYIYNNLNSNIDIFKKIDDEDHTNSNQHNGDIPTGDIRYGRYVQSTITPGYNQTIDNNTLRVKYFTINEYGDNVVDSASHLIASTQYNGLGQPDVATTQVSQIDSLTIADSYVRTNYKYDDFGRVRSVTNYDETDYKVDKNITYGYLFDYADGIGNIDNMTGTTIKINDNGIIDNIKNSSYLDTNDQMYLPMYYPLKYERTASYCRKQHSHETLENIPGGDSLINISIYDALGNKRITTSYLILQGLGVDKDTRRNTFFNYNIANQLVEVINPKDQQIRYWYNRIGKTQYVYQPDMGVNSYSYDNSGNIRFSQNATQANNKALTFYQYDRMNRMNVVGEATIEDGAAPTPISGDDLKNISNTNLHRLTDQIEPNLLHLDIEGTEDIQKDNPTLWASSPGTENSKYYQNFVPWGCITTQYPIVNYTLGINTFPYNGTLFKHIIDRNTESTQHSMIDNFENIQINPQNVRMVYIYDKMPESKGNVFGLFPTEDMWNSLAPNGLRNQQGRVSAIAYRDHNYQKFNYVVYSYDERGRVDAVIKLTDNIGFDAVYYKYNSMNSIITTYVANMTNTMVTWYGYDDTGRIDTVWASAGHPGLMMEGRENFMTFSPENIKNIQLDKANAKIIYTYNNSCQVTKISYPDINASITQTFDRIGRSDVMTAQMNDKQIFKQDLNYDLSTGNINKADNKYMDTTTSNYFYYYNNYDQSLSNVLHDNGTENGFSFLADYKYDELGNRNTAIANLGYVKQYSYADPAHPNAVTTITDSETNGTTDITYSANGAVSTRAIKSSSNRFIGYDLRYEIFDYDYRGLTTKFSSSERTFMWGTTNTPVCPNYLLIVPDEDVWQYSYSPFGERESKRQIQSVAYDNIDKYALSNCYYQLGGNGEQLAVYYGYQNHKGCFPIYNNLNDCCYSEDETAYYYLGEYNIYAPGGVPITYKSNEKGELVANYKIQDYLGNVRAVITQDKQITGMYDYMPFGEQITLERGNDRLSFIGKENDVESGLGDFGVRKYDDAAGRFLSIDPLWEKYLAWSPYHYCGNNPINGTDPSGLAEYLLPNGIIKSDNINNGLKFVTSNQTWSENSMIDEQGVETINNLESLQLFSQFVGTKDIWNNNIIPDIVNNINDNNVNREDGFALGLTVANQPRYAYGGQGIDQGTLVNVGNAVLVAFNNITSQGASSNITAGHSHGVNLELTPANPADINLNIRFSSGMMINSNRDVHVWNRGGSFQTSFTFDQFNSFMNR